MWYKSRDLVNLMSTEIRLIWKEGSRILWCCRLGNISKVLVFLGTQIQKVPIIISTFDQTIEGYTVEIPNQIFGGARLFPVCKFKRSTSSLNWGFDRICQCVCCQELSHEAILWGMLCQNRNISWSWPSCRYKHNLPPPCLPFWERSTELPRACPPSLSPMDLKSVVECLRIFLVQVQTLHLSSLESLRLNVV